MFAVVTSREEWEDYKAKLNAQGVPPGEEPEHIEHIGEPDTYPAVVCSVPAPFGGAYDHYFLDQKRYPETWQALAWWFTPTAA